ncbi:MAG: RNA polymerase sigma factor [Acidobacteriota bacterium]
MTVLSKAEKESFQQGDATLFRQLVDRHSPRLLSYLRSQGLQREEALDLLQEVWKKAYQKRAAFRGHGSVLGWLLSICPTSRLNLIRRDDPAGLPSLSREVRNPESLLERARERRAVRRAVLELPERQRDVVVLRLIEGYSVRETAGVLNCAEGTVKATLHQALRPQASKSEAESSTMNAF